MAESAQKLARERRAKLDLVEEAFIAGILHDIGKILLAANSPDAYSAILGVAKSRKQSLHQTEKEMLGYDHAEVGACILGLWGLDLAIVEAVWHHHDAELVGGQELTLSQLVHDANALVHAGAESGPAKPLSLKNS